NDLYLVDLTTGDESHLTPHEGQALYFAARFGADGAVWVDSEAGQLTPVIAIDPYRAVRAEADRKSTRLNSSHGSISYAVCCWKKKIPSDSVWTKRRSSRSAFDSSSANGPLRKPSSCRTACRAAPRPCAACSPGSAPAGTVRTS